jgi:hypothetical protein
LDASKVEWPISGNTTRPGLLGEKVSAENGGRGEISGADGMASKSEVQSFKKKVHPVLLKTWMPIHDLITSTRGMRPEEIELWKKHVDDAIWWRDPEAGAMEETEKKRRTITGALKKATIDDTEDAIFQRLSNMLKDRTTPPVNVNITNEQPAVNVETKPRQFTIDVQPTPVNIQVNPTPVTIENSVVSDAPVVNVQVEPTPVNIQNNIEPTPIIVTPTPITIENKNEINVPENKPEVYIEPSEPKNVTVIRDKYGKIVGMKEEKQE